MSSYDGTITLSWSPPPGADGALVCWELGATPPSAPQPPASCAGVVSVYGFFELSGVHGQQYAISVFSRSSSTGEYGPPVSVVVVATQSPPSGGFEDLSESAPTPTSIGLCWGGDGADAADSWSISMARGKDAPPAAAEPIAITRGGGTWTCHVIRRLERDTVYTFAIVGRNEAGAAAAKTITASTRAAAHYVAGPRAISKIPRSKGYSEMAATFAGRPGRLHAAYQAPVPGRRHTGVFYSVKRGGGWSRPSQFSRSGEWIGFGGPLIAGNEAGALVVAWSGALGEGAAYRYRAAGSSRWSQIKRLPPRAGHLDALALDRRGHVHFLMTAYVRRRDSNMLLYRTNATGRWTQGPIRGATCRRRSIENDSCGYPLLTYDTESDRLVLVAALREHTVTIADKMAAAAHFGRLHLRYRRSRGDPRLLLSAVTSRGGRITVALRTPPRATFESSPRDGLYVMTGDRPSRVGALTRVPGTGPRDLDGFLVAAATANRVLLAWQHDTATPPYLRHLVPNSWNPDRQGIWIATRVRRARTGRWTFTRPRHRTTSAYDVLESLLVDGDRRSRAHVVYRR